MANITKREWIKSTIFTAGTGVITLIITSLTAGRIPTWEELKPALLAAAAAAITSIWKYATTNTVDSAKEDIKGAIEPGDTVMVTKPKE